MLTLDLKARLRNKAFVISMVGAIVLLIQQLGFKIPSNYMEIVNSVLTILTMLGIVVDTSTKGVSDQVISATTEKAMQAENVEKEVQVKNSTVSVNNVVSENSQSANVDNQKEEAKIIPQ